LDLEIDSGAVFGWRKPMANIKRRCYSASAMDEGRKRIIYLAAAMFLCRRLASLDGRPSPARETAYRDSIDNAVELMIRLDARFPIPGKPR